MFALTSFGGVAVAIALPLGWYLTAPNSTPPDLSPGVATELAAASTGSPSDGISLPAVASTDPVDAPTGTSPAVGPPSIPVVGSPAVSGGAASSQSAQVVRPTRHRTTVGAPLPGSSPPVHVRIDAVGLDAPVVPVGVDRSGDLAIPGDVRTVGWYEYGTVPGSEAGSAVLAGHVDSARQGIGAFRALWRVTPGMIVTLQRAQGPDLRYRVVGRETFDKSTTPLAALFSTAGAARLTLITCGGPFDSDTHHYSDNVVVTAVPA